MNINSVVWQHIAVTLEKKTSQFHVITIYSTELGEGGNCVQRRDTLRNMTHLDI